MNHLGLFEGIGGFSLAAKWMGWETLAWCEWNEFGQKVLRHHFPDAEGFGDITKTDFTKYANRIDILTGGFPCQPYSVAGKRKGKEDERHLWPEMLRAIREVQPRWVVGENVSGLINWNGGMVFNEVQADLEAEGYEVQPFVLPACGVNAPHRRDRIWFIAYSSNQRCKDGGERYKSGLQVEPNGGYVPGNVTNSGKQRCKHNSIIREHEQSWQNGKERFKEFCESKNASNTNSSGWGQSAIQSELRTTKLEQLRRDTRQTEQTKDGKRQKGNEWQQWAKPNFEQFPTQSPICSRDDGFSARLDSITFPKWRNESIKAAGNAIVPQVAFEIYKAIAEYETNNPNNQPIPQ
jgi:DNA (cytosine-5)-methyltransferase 1